MDWLGHNLDMAADELGYAQAKAAALPDCGIKCHMVLALAAAEGWILTAQTHFSQAGSVIEKGMGDSLARFRRGKGQALEKPFPVTPVEKELLGVMEGLENSFAAVDRGIGKAEAAGGMRCEKGHYRGGESMQGQEREAALGVLWPARTLEKLTRQAHGAAHDAACRVDGMRPKARRVIKKAVLEEGIFREEGRVGSGEAPHTIAEAFLRKRADAGDKGKPSILKQLQEGKVPEVAEASQYYANRHNHAPGKGGMQR